MEKLQELGKRTLYNTGGYFVLSNLDFLRPDTNQPEYMQYLKSGGMLYLIEEGVELVLNGSSNLTRMDILKAADDIVFGSVTLYAVDKSGISEMIANVVPEFGPISDSLFRGVLMSVVQEAGDFAIGSGWSKLKQPVSAIVKGV